MENKKMHEEDREKWIEVFSNGDVWELEKIEQKLVAKRTNNDPQDYTEDELTDNGISTLTERARLMGLELEIED